MQRKKQQFILTGLLIVLVAGMNSLASAAITNIKNSADFTWKYEFSSDLPNESDLDSNGIGDFNVTGGGTLSGGILTMSSPVDYNYYYTGWGDGSKIWDVITDLDYAHGVTVEMSVKVLAASEGIRGATSLKVMPDGTDVDGELVIGKTSQSWGNESVYTVLGTGYDNTNDFHAFRIALDPNTETYSVWRDTELLGSGLLDTDSRTGLRRLIFGDGQSGPTIQGDVDIDYVRFTSGAYAPPTNTKSSVDFTWKYEFTSDLPNVSDLDSNGIGDFNVTGGGTLSGGILTMSSPVDYNYYYTGWGDGGKIWDVITDLDAHGVTVEMSVKVLAAAEGTRGATSLRVMPDGTDVDGELVIAKTGQSWGNTSAFTALGTNTYDNTDGFHAFRIAFDPNTETYSVWRDTELLGSGLLDTDSRTGLRRLIFGDGESGTSIKGDVEIDYVRFTSGFYAVYIPPPAGTLIILK